MSIGIVLLSLPALALALDGPPPSPSGYVRPELLIEPAELKRRLDQPTEGKLVLLDVRKRADFERDHVPGACWVDHTAWAGSALEPRTVPLAVVEGAPVDLFAPGVTLVVYDDAKANHAARIWWILRFWGCQDVRLLNGGWRGWQASQGPTRAGTPSTVHTLTVPSRRAKKHLAERTDVLAALGREQIVDSRSEAEHCGEDERAQRSGSIPGAKHLDWNDLLDPQTHRFRTAAELRALFRGAQIALDQPIIAHCQSGGRSSVMAFALELMGADHVRNYYASWAEWGNRDDTPIVKPKKK
ncbi:MAG TPA: rhodanese-like domain-containing protein [Gemmatales bacterium]|nr:rhodanese-like domain-containing protein [Gemmatales bacterium]HMP57925.1 rhodanese-like domain-containing protein [Gemmatales bacterium]